MSDDTAIATRDELPPAVLALSPLQQRAWVALAQGARFRDVARAIGVPTSTLWGWHMLAAFRPLRGASYLALADTHVDVLEARLADGLQPDADERALDRSLKAATIVQRGLGIGVPGGDATSPAPARVDVSITLDVADALSRPASARPPLDVDVLDAELVPVADTQPVRARVSSQRRRDE